jgi:GTPase SAR1 family protein
LTDPDSFRDLEKWIEDLKEYGDKDTTIIIAGNKSDLEDERKISFEDGSRTGKKFKVDFVEVSAKTGLNINILFELLSKYMIKKFEEPNISRIKRRGDKSKIHIDKFSMYQNKSSYYDKSERGGCCR